MLRAALLAACSAATLLCANGFAAAASLTPPAEPSSSRAPAAEPAPAGRTVRITITHTITKNGKTTRTVETIEDPASIQQVLKGEEPTVVERSAPVVTAAPVQPQMEPKTAKTEKPVSAGRPGEAAAAQPDTQSEPAATAAEPAAGEAKAPIAKTHREPALSALAPIARQPTVLPLPETKPDARPEPKFEPKTPAAVAARMFAPSRPQLHVIVSIDKQRATLFENGEPIGSAPISSGTPGHPTPMGIFTVIQKDRHHVSNLYDAPMPYMQRITWSGSALHEGPLPGYPASHGCVRLPSSFAQLLWRTTRLGARVIITRPNVAPRPFEHAKLFVPAAAEPGPMATSGLKSADASGAVPAFAMAKAASNKPISVFVSLREHKLYVRQGWQPLFDAPIKFENPGAPVGTHIYTAMGVKDDGALRWTVVSIPSDTRRLPPEPKHANHSRKSRGDRTEKPVEIAGPSPSAALDRLLLPPELVERISELITPGSSLIVSDNALSQETDKSTDFIVLTP